MKERIQAFLDDLDGELAKHAACAAFKVYHIGRSALVWRYDAASTTKDLDFLKPDHTPDAVEEVFKMFAKDAPRTQPHGLYLEFVVKGFPPVPAGFAKRAVRADGSWRVLEVYHLDPHDLAATKLRRFAPKDREDIRFLCDLGLLDPDTLERVLEEAFRWTMEKDGDPFRDDAFSSLGIVQRYLRGEIGEF